MKMTVRKYRIRHCNGDKSSWIIIALREDGSETDSYSYCSSTPSMGIDPLIKWAGKGALIEIRT